MAYRMKSSGLPFKELGSSPAKQKGMTGLTEEERKMKRAKLSSDVKSFVTGKKVDSDPGTKKKSALGIEDPAELAELYKTTENPNNRGRQ